MRHKKRLRHLAGIYALSTILVVVAKLLSA